MSQTVWLLCGIPGSGKSYFAKNVLKKDHFWTYISRDDIRFAMVDENEEYFSKENKVYDTFIHQINFALGTNIQDIIVDATHINTASRMKLLKRLRMFEDTKVIAVWMDTPLEVCLERNEKREGRQRVPKSVIRRMYYQRNHPSNDPFEYTAIMEVGTDDLANK